jgi:hypothetical protein
MTSAKILLAMLLFPSGLTYGQTQVYDDFEGTKAVRYASKTGVLDTIAKNPAAGSLNPSPRCALYVRNASKRFDNIKMAVNGKLSDLNPYATYVGTPPQLSMKVYTNAPVGTLVELLLGDSKGNNDYPAGTNSQYQAYTSKSGEWEELHFKFSQIPEGSEVPTTGVNQVTLLFSPNTLSSDTYYFDELTGPAVISVSTGVKPPEKIKPEKK